MNKGNVMKIQTFINEFKLTFVYALLRQTLTDDQLFEYSVQDGQVTWFKEQTRQMWHLWTTAAAEEVPDGFALVKVAKAQAVPEGFVLIKDDTKTVVAIERMVEQQVEASGMDSRRLERLDGWKIIEAAVKAQEPAND